MEKTEEFTLVDFKLDFLTENRLPCISYPIPYDDIKEITETGGNIEFTDLLFYLQQYSACLKEGWEELDPAMLRLTEILAQEDDNPVGNIYTPDFYIHLQPHDLSLEVITMIRGDRILAAIFPGSDFTVSMSAFHPFDARTMNFLMQMARHPHNGGVCMRENNWEYALDMAAPTLGSMYACERGDSYLSYWENGLGVCSDGKIDSTFETYRTRKQIMPNIVAAQIGCYYERMDDDCR